MNTCENCEFFKARSVTVHSPVTKSFSIIETEWGVCKNTNPYTPYAVNKQFGCIFLSLKIKGV